MNGFMRLCLLLASLVFASACAGETFMLDDELLGSSDVVAGSDEVDGTDQVGRSDAPVVYHDLDGDGYSSKIDCNDNDGNVHPDADEVCDGKDNDCNSQTDEGQVTVFYQDADKDGYGLPEAATNVCHGAEPPAGYTATGGDCNDSNADANGDGKVDGFWFNPGAAETCGDDIDNDCNGQTDDNCAVREIHDLPLGDNFALVVIWPSEKVGQAIMAVPYYANEDIGADWIWFQESSTSAVMTVVPDGNACGIRFNTAYGKPATEWLCQDGKVNPEAKIVVIKADGSSLDVTNMVDPWEAPEGGCSTKLRLHACE